MYNWCPLASRLASDKLTEPTPSPLREMPHGECSCEQAYSQHTLTRTWQLTVPNATQHHPADALRRSQAARPSQTWPPLLAALECRSNIEYRRVQHHRPIHHHLHTPKRPLHPGPRISHIHVLNVCMVDVLPTWILDDDGRWMVCHQGFLELVLDQTRVLVPLPAILPPPFLVLNHPNSDHEDAAKLNKRRKNESIGWAWKHGLSQSVNTPSFTRCHTHSGLFILVFTNVNKLKAITIANWLLCLLLACLYW